MSGAPQVYGADEVNAVVLDQGSCTTQYGFAGWDHPSCVVPSAYGMAEGHRIFDENVLYSTPRGDVEVREIVRNNMVRDWDGAAAQWKHLTETLNVDPSEQPLLQTESTMNSFANKKRAMEVAFEDLGHCAYFAAKQPSCVSFAHGRPNCLVVDVGDDLVTVTPVIDGFALKNSVQGTTYGGRWLEAELAGVLAQRGVGTDTLWTTKYTKGQEWEGREAFAAIKGESLNCALTDSLRAFKTRRTMFEMKESVVECAMEDDVSTAESDLVNPSQEALDNEDTRFFELPNGVSVPFTLRERQLLGNSLFNPAAALGGVVKGWEEPCRGDIRAQLVQVGDITSKEYVPLRRSKKGEEDGVEVATPVAEDPLGLTALVNSVLSRLDVDVKPQLANNIILTGATTLIPKLSERLTQELVLLNPSMKIRVHCSGNPTERKHGAWIGGSILASLGTFHQLWVSKQEWQEVGPERLVVNRFR